MTPDMPRDLATVVSQRSGQRLHASLSGEIDLSNADSVRDRLREVLGDARDIEVDLSELRFLDSSALRILVDLHDDLSASGRTLIVTTSPGGRAAQILAVSGVDRALDVSFAPPEQSARDQRE